MNLRFYPWLLPSLVLLSAAQATTGVQRIPLLEHNTYGFVGGMDPRPSTIPALTLPYDHALERAYGKTALEDCSYNESRPAFKLGTEVWKVADGHFTQNRALEQLYGFQSCETAGNYLYGLGIYRQNKLVFAFAVGQPHGTSFITSFKVIPQIGNNSVDLVAVLVPSNNLELNLVSFQTAKLSSRYFRGFQLNLGPDVLGTDGFPPHTVDLVLQIKGVNIQAEVTPYKMLSAQNFKRLDSSRVLPSQRGMSDFRVLPL